LNKLQTTTEFYNIYTKTVSPNTEQIEENKIGEINNVLGKTDIKLCYCWECKYFNLSSINTKEFYLYKNRLMKSLNIDVEVLNLIFDIWDSNMFKDYHSIHPQNYNDEINSNEVLLIKSEGKNDNHFEEKIIIERKKDNNIKKVLWAKKNDDYVYTSDDEELDDSGVIDEIEQSQMNDSD